MAWDRARFRTFKFHTEIRSGKKRTYLNLLPPAPLTCRGRGVSSSPFLQKVPPKRLYGLRTKKDWKGQRDTHSTSMLGVSCR